MKWSLDNAVEFDLNQCNICGKTDREWFVLQFLNDGVWRKIPRGQSLRDIGIDEPVVSTVHLYCIHSCTESIIRDLSSLQDIDNFMLTLNERL